MRYDHYSDFGDTVNPRVGLVWSFLDNADLKLLYGQAFRAPNFVELYDANNPVVVGNTGLKPEKIKTYEAGITYRLNRFLATDLNYFYSSIDDLIVWDTTVKPVPRFANIGNSTTQGVEVGLNGTISSEFSWKTNYTWQDPRDTEPADESPYVPSQRATGSINYAPTKIPEPAYRPALDRAASTRQGGSPSRNARLYHRRSGRNVEELLQDPGDPGHAPQSVRPTLQGSGHLQRKC